MRAWVDESIRVDRAPAPMYLLGASIIETEAEADIVSALRSRAPRAGKLHWRELGDRGRAGVLTLLPTLQIDHLVVIAAPLRPEIRIERARGQCIERLLWELALREVASVTFESRSPAQDKADRRRVDGLRSRRLIPDELFVDWVPGVSEPLLWAPDLMLGAVGDARANCQPVPAELAPLLTEVCLSLIHI